MRLLSKGLNSLLGFLHRLSELLQNVEIFKEGWLVALVVVLVLKKVIFFLMDATH